MCHCMSEHVGLQVAVVHSVPFEADHEVRRRARDAKPFHRRLLSLCRTARGRTAAIRVGADEVRFAEEGVEQGTQR